MDKLLEKSLLYDFYGEMLTDYQKEIYEDFKLNDLSLAEIADDRGITRQGVHEIVKRCDKKLADYEKRLHLVEKFISIKARVSQINECAEKIKSEEGADVEGLASEIENISSRIIDEL